MSDKRAATIRAAGGVVWRAVGGLGAVGGLSAVGSGVEVAVVHRARYDDWSLPKGKLEHDESELLAAVREVREEVGSEVAVSRRLTRVSYHLNGSKKTVAYWVMRHLSGAFEPDDEVDAIEWLSPATARARLTYDLDRRVLSDFAATPVPESVVIVVRHAKAGKRSAWGGADELRPLDRVGLAQADRLAAFLGCFAPDRVIAANPLRCIQTVLPLAESLDLTLTVDPVFGDECYERSAEDTETALVALATPRTVTVVSSQGTTIPGLIETLAMGGSVCHTRKGTATRKGAAWVLTFVGGSVVSADYYDSAAR